MNKFLLVIFALASIVLFAKKDSDVPNKGSHGYNSNNVEAWDGNTDSYTYESGVFNIKKDGDMLLKLYQPASKNGQVVTDFGYYYLNGQNKGKEYSLITKWTGKGTAVLPGNSTYTVPNLKENDKIGFYCSYSDDTTVYSQQIKNADETDLFFPLTCTNQEVDYYTFGMDNETWIAGGVLAFSFEGFKTKTIEEEEEGGDTTGQPLPGVIATVVLGGACVGYLKKRKNAKK